MTPKVSSKRVETPLFSSAEAKSLRFKINQLNRK